jgi:D-hexose-6-phosphate mutarotase
LHTYFSISGRNRVTLPGVTGLTYLDKPQRYKRLEQTDAITISGEVDRVYLAPPGVTIILWSGTRVDQTQKRWQILMIGVLTKCCASNPPMLWIKASG